jgi:phage repressor protein C with HTH and peptisase S24 domain
MENLLLFSQFYKLSIDTLIKVDLSKLSERQVLEMEMGNDPFLAGTQLRVLATTVNADNEDNVELVPEKAKAGYATGYADPEFIEQLPTFNMPMLKQGKKYRTFAITGDSMHPIPSGSYVTASYLDDWRTVKTGDACIIVTHEDGVVFKIVENNIQTNRTLRLISLNPLFEPYNVSVSEVSEIWKFVHYISEVIPENAVANDSITNTLVMLQQELMKVKQHVGI